MTTFDSSTGLSDGNFQFERHVPVQISRIVDFAKIFNGAPVLAASADTYNLLNIPAGFVVEDVYLTTTVQGTGSSVFSMGDTADAAYYFAAGTTAAASATGSVVKTGTVAGAAGKFKDITSVTTLSLRMTQVYTAASYLTITFGGANAPVAGKLKVSVRGFYLV